MKKILYLMEYPIDLPGGGQMSTETLCTGLTEMSDYKPYVCCPELLNKNKSEHTADILSMICSVFYCSGANVITAISGLLKNLTGAG